MSNPLIDPTKVIIPVDVAIAKTTYWRKFIQDSCPTADPHSLPKGVYISRGDIADMAKYLEADDTLVGVRAYFTLENDHELTPDKNEVKFIMVLVRDTKGYVNGQDLLYIPEGEGMNALSPDQGKFDDSNVYDFTRPCPDCCDPTSDLFGEQPTLPLRRKI